MSASAEIATPPSRRTILVATLSAAAAGGLILLAAVLPAEYGLDPIGLGRLTGTAKLYAPNEVKVAPVVGKAAAQRSETRLALREDVVRIPLAAAGDPDNKHQIEYKVRMPTGATTLYSWTIEGLPEKDKGLVLSQLHGHTVEDEATMTVVDYRLSIKDSDAGVLNAAIDGIHGWYFENRAKVPVTITVKLAGFYTLVPPGEPGNEGRLLPEGGH